MSAYILGTSWEQCVSMVQYCFMSLCPWKPWGSLGWTAQDGHLDYHTAPELMLDLVNWDYIYIYIPSMKYKKYWLSSLHHHEWWCNSFCSFILAPRIKIISPWSLPFLDSTTTVTHNCLSLNHCTNWHSMLHDTCCWHMIYICTAVANHLS